MAFLSENELRKIGLLYIGKRVRISERATFHSPHLVRIGDDVRIDDFVVVSGRVTFGNYVHIGVLCSILAGSEEVLFHDFSGLAPGCRIFSASDDYLGSALTNPTVPLKYRKPIVGKVIFERHAIVGSNSVVLPGVTLNEGASVGALSLVNRDVDAWTISAGVPIRTIAKRKRDLLKLEKTLHIELHNQIN